MPLWTAFVRSDATHTRWIGSQLHLDDVYQAVAEAISQGRLTANSRSPSAMRFAGSMGCARSGRYANMDLDGRRVVRVIGGDWSLNDVMLLRRGNGEHRLPL